MPNNPQQDERIVLFCKYPRPGNVKTRLIDHLGADMAAQLQAEMATHVLNWMRVCAKKRGCGLELRYLGAEEPKMRAVFGDDLVYREQGQGDFGDRIARAVHAAFRDKVRRVLAVGADCPTATAHVLAAAFDALKTHDVVVGPATDGGYYLIGLSRDAPFLFKDIRWGTSAVLEKTLQKIGEHRLSLQLLEPMSDVDRPEDLEVWYEAKKNVPKL